MLRIFALLLVLLNSAYFAWSEGWLRFYGLGPTSQTEPHRLHQQIQPEALRLLDSPPVPMLTAVPAESVVPATSAPVSAGPARP